MKLKTKEEIYNELKQEKEESNSQATNRIGEELRKAKKEEERKKSVFDFFFILTGLPMTEEEYTLYMEEWNKRDTYNIKTFIRDRHLLKDLRLKELGVLDWGTPAEDKAKLEHEIKVIKKQLEDNANDKNKQVYRI